MRNKQLVILPLLLLFMSVGMVFMAQPTKAYFVYEIGEDNSYYGWTASLVVTVYDYGYGNYDFDYDLGYSKQSGVYDYYGSVNGYISGSVWSSRLIVRQHYNYGYIYHHNQITFNENTFEFDTNEWTTWGHP